MLKAEIKKIEIVLPRCSEDVPRLPVTTEIFTEYEYFKTCMHADSTSTSSAFGRCCR